INRSPSKNVGLGVPPPDGADILIDGSRELLDVKWTYWEGPRLHTNHTIQKVWGGPNSGIDGGNDGGAGITDVPGGVKLQCEGHEVLFRNAWIKPLELLEPDTDF
ncbi:MAG: hypothetical protein JW828_14820, partial [Sedimentisphaerales bacterium]|nr:hypothetical protein [Sedimentisphaerales bacterium]